MATFWPKYDFRACSPVDTLPVELLTYIFSLASHGIPVATEGKESPLFDSESVKMPTRLSAVNRHWRMVARNTSALWTSLCATIASIHKTCHNGQRLSLFHTSHLSSHLSLSRNQTLDIIIDARDPDWDFSEPRYVLISYVFFYWLTGDRHQCRTRVSLHSTLLLSTHDDCHDHATPAHTPLAVLFHTHGYLVPHACRPFLFK